MQRPLLTAADRTSGLRSICFTDPHVAQSQNSVLPLRSKAGIGSIVFQLKEVFTLSQIWFLHHLRLGRWYLPQPRLSPSATGESMAFVQVGLVTRQGCQDHVGEKEGVWKF